MSNPITSSQDTSLQVTLRVIQTQRRGYCLVTNTMSPTGRTSSPAGPSCIFNLANPQISLPLAELNEAASRICPK